MDIYDFDGTLYRGDSTADFVRFCAIRHPRILRTLPRTGAAALSCLAFKRMTKTQFKQVLYRFLPLIPDVAGEVEQFWAAHAGKIAGPCNPQPGDLVISASPEFLLHDICKERGLSLLASPVDPQTGEVLGPNCSGNEKVVRLNQAYPGAKVERFYSDSHNDDPLAALADEAFLVKGGSLQPWKG